MGADLYIDKLDKEIMKKYPYEYENWSKEDYDAREKLRNEQHAYYRDSYNGTNLMWIVGFSYWQSPKELGWSFRKDGHLSVKGVKQFLSYLKEMKPEFDAMFADRGRFSNYLRDRHCELDCETVESWKEYFSNKYDELRIFLETAIANGSSIRWSV